MVRVGDKVRIGNKHASERYYKLIVGEICEVVKIHASHTLLVQTQRRIKYANGNWAVHVEHCLPIIGQTNEENIHFLQKEESL